MKILAISDVESKYFWDYFRPEKVADIDLILSAGDLDPDYLSFLVTLSHAPVLYVHGNHDRKYERKPPLGCECIEDKIYTYKGIRILGLGGSMNYSNGVHQYTEKEMRRRVRKLFFSLFRKKGFDILLTHAPARDLNDENNLSHRGFQVFRDLMDRYHPRYFIHGHVHKNYGKNYKQIDHYGDTIVVNAYDHCIIEYEIDV